MKDLQDFSSKRPFNNTQLENPQQTSMNLETEILFYIYRRNLVISDREMVILTIRKSVRLN